MENVAVFISAQGKENAMKKRSDDWIDDIIVKEWMNAIVDIRVKEAGLGKMGGSLKLIPPDMEVHVYEGIETIASAAGAELVMEILKEATYPFKYSFVYRGIKFFQVSNVRLEERGEGVLTNSQAEKEK